MQTPTSDPIPWVTERLRKVGAFNTQTEEVYSYRDQSYTDVERPSDYAVAALLDVLTQTVSALHDDAKSYTVILNKAAATAGTLLEKRVVEVGSKPWRDAALTEGQKAAVMAGLALHEVGHIRYGRGWKAALTRHFGQSKVTPAILSLSNLAADCHDEAEVIAAFPGLADAIPVTLWWVADKGVSKPLGPLGTVPERVNAAISAARYSWSVDWDGSAEQTEWRQWWAAWAIRARQADRPSDHAVVVAEAIAKCRDIPAREEPPQQEQPQPQPQPKGSEPQQQQSGPSANDDEPQPEQEPGEGEGKAEAEGDGEGEGKQPGDEPGEQPGESKPEPAEGEGQRSTEGGESRGDEAGQGATAGDLTEVDPSEWDERALDDPCAVAASRDTRSDERLQQYAEREWRGKREGMRRRHYDHKASVFGPDHYNTGRDVVMVPFKNGRWVRDV